MTTRSTTARGRGLFTGAPAVITVTRQPQGTEIAWRIGDRAVPRSAFVVADAPRTTALLAGDTRLLCVEHFFAALAGLGIQDGLSFAVEGGELPLLGGGAAEFVALLRDLTQENGDPQGSFAPPLRIVCEGEVRVGLTVLRFRPPRPGDTRTRVRTAVEFGDPRLVRRAAWDGSAAQFSEQIAPARPFVFARELAGIEEAGIQFHVEPGAAVVLDEAGGHASGRPFTWHEPVRHKLLDLLGDLYAWGGPPLGTVFAYRPGHASTHQAMRRALAEGMVVRDA